jgi:uncharacterized protein YkwD
MLANGVSRWLVIALCAACLACSSAPAARAPAPTAQASPPAQTQVQGGDLGALERGVATEVDAHRRTRGLRALEYSDFVAQVARTHSRSMASAGALGHDGMQRRADELASQLPFKAMGENVYRHGRSSGLAAATVEGWLGSPVHRTNLEGDYHLTGVGAVRSSDGSVYLTQIFVRTDP